MESNLLDTLSELTKALSKELQREGLVALLADAAKQFVDEIEEIHEGDLLKLTDRDRELRQKEMEKYPVHATLWKDGRAIGYSSSDGVKPKGMTRPGGWYDGTPCCGPGESCSSSTCTGTPRTGSTIPLGRWTEEPTLVEDKRKTVHKVESADDIIVDPEFPFGLDLGDLTKSGTTGTTVFPSVGLYELINKLSDSQKDGLIESLGGGRWVRLDTLKKVIDKMEHTGPRFNVDPLRAQ